MGNIIFKSSFCQPLPVTRGDLYAKWQKKLWDLAL